MPLTKPTNHLVKSDALFPKFEAIGLFALFVSAGILLPLTNAVAAVSADKIKAAYLFQLTKFATWPNTSSSADKVFTICVLGNESINDELKPLNRRKAKGQRIKVSHLNTLKDASHCNILYIAKTAQPQLQRILEYSSDKQILTVSSVPGFAANGGSVGFVIVKNKVRLEINRAPARRAGIKLSAKLLEVASVVIDDASGGQQP